MFLGVVVMPNKTSSSFPDGLKGINPQHLTPPVEVSAHVWKPRADKVDELTIGDANTIKGMPADITRDRTPLKTAEALYEIVVGDASNTVNRKVKVRSLDDTSPLSPSSCIGPRFVDRPVESILIKFTDVKRASVIATVAVTVVAAPAVADVGLTLTDGID